MLKANWWKWLQVKLSVVALRKMILLRLSTSTQNMILKCRVLKNMMWRSKRPQLAIYVDWKVHCTVGIGLVIKKCYTKRNRANHNLLIDSKPKLQWDSIGHKLKLAILQCCTVTKGECLVNLCDWSKKVSVKRKKMIRIACSQVIRQSLSSSLSNPYSLTRLSKVPRPVDSAFVIKVG